MRQAIVTKYLGPTDHRPARIMVKAQAGKLFVTWDDALDVDENHDRAAQQFAQRLNWSGTLAGGALPDGRGNCYVFVERK